MQKVGTCSGAVGLKGVVNLSLIQGRILSSASFQVPQPSELRDNKRITRDNDDLACIGLLRSNSEHGRRPDKFLAPGCTGCTSGIGLVATQGGNPTAIDAIMIFKKGVLLLAIALAEVEHMENGAFLSGRTLIFMTSHG